MKTKILIITFLIMALLVAFTLTSKAQCCSIKMVDYGYLIQDTTLIADETNLTYTKTGAKIITYSDAVFKEISLKFGDQFKAIHIYYKKDRHGPYKEYQITISTELANNIKEWAKTNL